MKVKCDYCGSLIDDGLSACPNCGASMPTANRTSSGQPKTIEDLKKWYQARKLPPENVTRFFIGKNIKEPKAFGIYKDSNGDFVVYKNKGNGERSIRYQGKDEGYAVNEFYQRLRVEIADQKSYNTGKSKGNGKNSGNKGGGKKGGQGKQNKKMGLLDWLLLPILLPFTSPVFATIYLVIGILIAAFSNHSPSKGYYSYDGNDYYYQGSTWYSYDYDTDEWDYASNSSFLDDLITNDNDDDYRIYDHFGSQFEDTDWYVDSSSDDSYDWDSGSSWSDSWDSDYSWDSDSSWDFDSSDWDSDW